MSFLNGLLRTIFATGPLATNRATQRSILEITSGNVTLTDDPSNDTTQMAINTTSFPGSGGIITTTADVDAWTPVDGSVKSYFVPGTDTTTTNATPANVALYLGTSPVSMTYTTSLVTMTANVFAFKDTSNYGSFRVSRTFKGAAGVYTAAAATADDGTVTVGTASAWVVDLDFSTAGVQPALVSVTGAAATTIKWRTLVQINLGVVTP